MQHWCIIHVWKYCLYLAKTLLKIKNQEKKHKLWYFINFVHFHFWQFFWIEESKSNFIFVFLFCAKRRLICTKMISKNHVTELKLLIIIKKCSFSGDVDSADNEEETDSELHLPSKLQQMHDVKIKNVSSRNYLFGNNSINVLEETLRVTDSLSNGIPSSLGLLRSNQVFRSKVKHETKLWVVNTQLNVCHNTTIYNLALLN